MPHSERVATAPHSEWQRGPAPKGVKVLLLTRGGVAVIGDWYGDREYFVAWAPLPRIPIDIKEELCSPPTS